MSSRTPSPISGTPSHNLHLDPATGCLPLGRHRATEVDIQSEFVSAPTFSASTTRLAAWSDYELGRDLLRSKLRVHAVWIGGSFLTNKVDAKDVDALFIISARDYDKLDVDGKRVVQSFLPQRGPLGTTVRGHGLDRLDSFLLPWRPISPFDPISPLSSPDHVQYAVARGYWDDWWPRERFNKPSGNPPHWKDALPVRGYVEVELDGYDR